MILRPSEHCALCGSTYVIDAGDGRKDISSYLDENDTKISLVLTHSHNDHIGGIFHLLPRVNQIKEIIIPYYHNEIILIAKALESLLGIERVAYNSWPIKVLSEYNLNNTALNRMVLCAAEKPKIIFGHEGYKLCNHFCFLNPPIERIDEDVVDEQRIERVTGLFNESFGRDLKYWLSARLLYEEISDTPEIDREAIDGYGQSRYDGIRTKAWFVLSFLEQNYDILLTFTQAPTIKKLTTIVHALDLTANQASLVFKFDVEDKKQSILFTGDIDVSVFERIIANGCNIKANILKVPHHGSKTGLNDRVLDEIKPECAIISHGNKRFGRAKDPHPNAELINMLKRRSIDICVTNDVVKNGSIFLSCEDNSFHSVFDIR